MVELGGNSFEECPLDDAQKTKTQHKVSIGKQTYCIGTMLSSFFKGFWSVFEQYDF